MTYLAAAERTALCDLALDVGPDAPTLCEGWAVRDLVAHLVLRDGSLAAVGIAVPPLAPLTERGMDKLAAGDFTALVTRLRQGPPWHSPFRLRTLDRHLNAMEYFVHHEDIRRAQSGWAPRDLAPRVQDAVWGGLTAAGRGLVRRTKVGVVVARTDTSATKVLKKSDRSVTIQGPPAELAMFLFGRTAQSRVDLVGDPAAVALLTRAPLGF